MSALAATQRDFLASLFQDGPAENAGLQVYRRTVIANLAGALAAAFPVIERLVGRSFFAEAARQHALQVPSTSGDLSNYGAGFAAFLGSYEPAREHAYLPGVARLEWALHECHGAADSQAFDFTALARVPLESQGAIRLLLQPEVRLVRSRQPVLSIWQANQPARDGTPDRESGAEHVLVRRLHLVATPSLLPQEEWAFLVAIAAGNALEEAAACFADPEALGPALARLAASGVFSGFVLPRTA